MKINKQIEQYQDYINKAEKTISSYREMLERARKTLQDAWDDDGSTVIGNQILETINAIDDLLGENQEINEKECRK